MYQKCLLVYVLLILCCFSNDLHAQKHKRFFRKDYKYIAATQAFYKFHTSYATWQNAKQMCESEGASLFYAVDDNEAQEVLSFWKDSQPYGWIFTGISDLLVKGLYATVDGIPISTVYNDWLPGEPNDVAGKEDCVVLSKEGKFNDDECSRTLPYICKKTISSLAWNDQCKMPYLNYTYFEGCEGKCYRFHDKPMNWTEAYRLCYDEESYLAIINSESEATCLINLIIMNKYDVTEIIPKDNKMIHLDFLNRLREGWRTVKGTTLDESGYARWGVNQPDSCAHDRDENCGAMSYTGDLHDIECDIPASFICEHDIVP